uniref:U4/U6.U5 small nuclear ribonucleoprotein 27kDa protein domain-containing protein n=2 Tax=Bionectria ochroleuca TaxID=29856 RepID=A0A8H7KB77_BIOOC
MSFNVGRRSGSPSSTRDADTPMREESRGRDRPEDDDDEPEEDEDPDMAAMKAMMGFGGFDTTKNKKVSGNDVGGLRKEKKSEYRQYMNRQGGFNRPLSPSR